MKCCSHKHLQVFHEFQDFRWAMKCGGWAISYVKGKLPFGVDLYLPACDFAHIVVVCTDRYFPGWDRVFMIFTLKKWSDYSKIKYPKIIYIFQNSCHTDTVRLCCCLQPKYNFIAIDRLKLIDRYYLAHF